MNIIIEEYNEEWPNQFENLKIELSWILRDLSPKIEHFGSTSVPGLTAKPVIDILVGIEDTSQFTDVIKKMKENKLYIYLEAFNSLVPDRRMFMRLKDEVNPDEFDKILPELKSIPHEKLNHSRLAHIHIWEYNSSQWHRHLAFRNYLRCHPKVSSEYDNLKRSLSKQEWSDGMHYNDAKNDFIKIEERKAIAWYNLIS